MNSIDVNFFARKRYMVVFLISSGLCISFILRTNLSIAMIEMGDAKIINTTNGTMIKEAEFSWSPVEKGLLISAFSWGYFISFLGGILAIHFGGATIYGLGIALTGIITILTPYLIRSGFYIYLCARIMEGVLEGFSKASMGELFTRWAPNNERTRFILFSEIGAPIGIAIGFPLSSYLVAYWGWESMFYITGGISIIWFSIWVVLVRSDPKEDKFILKDEQNYLQQNTRGSAIEKKISYPWKQILTSKPLLAYLNDRFVESWSLSFIVYCVPFYIKDVHDTNIENIGILSTFPISSSLITIIFGSFVADYLRCKQILSVSNVHKLFITTGQILAIITLTILIFWDNFVVGIACISLFRMFYAIANISYTVLPVDMAGIYAGLVNGMGITCISIGYLMNPIVMNAIVTHHTIGEWNMYFSILCCFNIWGGIIFFIFGSGELEPWAKDT